MLELIPDRPAFCNDSETVLDLLIRVTAPMPAQERERPEINLSLVLDRSGSMQGSKLQMTCQAAGLAVQALREQDRVSVVVFDDQVQTLVPCGPVTDKQRIADLLSQVTAGGSTALHDGWKQGVTQACQATDERRINRVLLLTDGEANQGEVNPDRICSEVRQLAMKGVQTTTLGFGSHYNETLLRSMAASGEGNHFYVERADQLAGFFAMELEGLTTTRGTKVRLTLQPLVAGATIEPQVKMDRAEDGSLMLGDLVAGKPLELLFRLTVPAQDRERPVLEALLSYHSLERASEETCRHSLQLMVLSQAQRADICPNARVLVQAATAKVVRMRLEAMSHLTDGREGQAMRILREARKIQHMPAEERALLQDLIETLERRDYSSGHKKAMMHGHGHGKGHGACYLRPRNSQDALRSLLTERSIALSEGPLLASVPPAGERPWERVQGMLRGLVHGDGLGNSSSWADLKQRRQGEGAALALATLRQLADWGSFNGMRLATELARAPVHTISPSLHHFRERIRRGEEWHECGAASAGCGALRRIAPVLVGRLLEPEGLWSDVAVACMITHNDNASLVSCLGFTAVLWDLLAMERPPAPTWYLERFLEAIEGLEKGEYTSIAPRHDGWKGRLSEYVRERILEARQRGFSVEQAMRDWGTGPFLLEIVPTLLYILELHGEHPNEALRASVSKSVEAGSLGALVGAAVGALHGTQPSWDPDPDLEQLLKEAATSFRSV